MENIEIQKQPETPAITFVLPISEGNEEVIKITKGKFYWKGEEVEDSHQIYERFNEWLSKIEHTNLTKEKI